MIIRVAADAYDRSILGLIANKLMGQYQCPIILVAKNQEGLWAGSARATGIENFRSIVEESQLVSFASGHESAFGTAFKDENYQSLVDYFDSKLKNVIFSTNYKVDFIFSQSTLKSQTIIDIDNFKYLWGQGVEEPLIAVEDIKVTKDMLTLMARDRNPTLKIQMGDIAAIKFKSSEEELASLESEGYTTINIVAKCQINKYYDRITP